MIRIEIGRGKSKVEADGNLLVIYSEMTCALKKIYGAVAGEIGEEAAKKHIKKWPSWPLWMKKIWRKIRRKYWKKNRNLMALRILSLTGL